MKKLMTILVLFARCGVAMAADAQTVDPNKPIDLTMNIADVEKTVTVPRKEITEREYNKLVNAGNQNVERKGNWLTGYKYYYNEHQETQITQQKVTTTRDYLNVKENGTLGNSGLTYTITASQDYDNGKLVNGFVRQTAQGYFTVTEDVPANKVVAVQFLGAEIEDGSGNITHNSSDKISDYGIYLYDTAKGEKVGDYLSVRDFNNFFGEAAGIEAGTSFGVYYKDNNGNIIASTGDGMKRNDYYGYYYGEAKDAKNGMLGNFDINSHTLTVYDSTGNPTPQETNKHFMCLSSGEYGKDSFQIVHWEFMLQTTLDDPYYPVNPKDFFDGDGAVVVDDPVVNGVTGQPLPGTLATLLIGGLCAGSLRKRNKK